MSRKTIISVLAAGITVFSISAAIAGNAGNSLGDCYNHVISACNETAHPVPCSNSGMDACDEEHSAAIDTGNIGKFRITPNKTQRLVFTR